MKLSGLLYGLTAGFVAGLTLGMILSLHVRRHSVGRFEKTQDLHIRFDTLTGKNCWAGPDNAFTEYGGGLSTSPPSSNNVDDYPMCSKL